jgi:hypothetical protein
MVSSYILQDRIDNLTREQSYMTSRMAAYEGAIRLIARHNLWDEFAREIATVLASPPSGEAG